MNDLIAASDGVELVADAAAQLLGGRHDALMMLLHKASPEPVPNETLDLLISGATAAVGAASAGIGGVVAANIATRLVGDGAAGREFVKSAFKDVIDATIQSTVGDDVAALAKGSGLSGGEGHEAFFLGQGNAIRRAVPEARRVAKEQARDVAATTSDPEQALQGMHRGLLDAIDVAQAKQFLNSSTEWLNVLAKVDLGTVSDDNVALRRVGRQLTHGVGADAFAGGGAGDGADLREMEGSRKGLGELLFDGPDRGVVRVDLWGRNTDEPYRVGSVRLAGTNPEMVDALVATGLTLDKLGVNVWASGTVYENTPRHWGRVEFGQNDAGGLHVADREDNAEAWLGFYGQGVRSDPATREDHPELWREAEYDADAGARLILDDMMAQTPAELGLRHG